ncbi:MAG: hypothetical protein P8N67_05915 [Pseudomonadales bacterium]|nr:hypothetical protein [Pseudomonadales bacterium]
MSFFGPGITAASANTPVSSKPAKVTVGEPSNVIWDLTDKSDREINELVRSWPQLQPAQRRDLLAEVRSRMNKARVQSVAPNNGQRQNGQSDIEEGLVRAQRQFRYGQPIPRNQKGTVVITAKVTRVLPDGSRVTQSTVTPVPLEELRKRSANGSAVANIRLPQIQPSNIPNDKSRVVSAKTGTLQPQQPSRQVFRATVRFGAGFGRRAERNQVNSQAPAQRSVKTVNAPVQAQNISYESEQNPAQDSQEEKVLGNNGN